MTDIREILDQVPVDQIAGLLGTDRETARAAVEAAVPTLLAGMQSNVQAPEGAASLESALAQHQNGLVDGGVDAAQVDTADGEKIVSHVFGGQQDQVANQLAGTANLGGVGGDLVRKLLPILAPIVMSYLANKILGGRNAQAGGGAAGDAAGGPGGIDLGSILGGILGGASQGGAGAQGGLGDILGGILGGGPQGGQQSRDAVVPEPRTERAPQPPTGPLGQPIPQGGAPVPGEVVDVDLPGDGAGNGSQDRPDEKKNDGGGLGGLLGGLFGKK
ncbi:hypothetical protein TV39_07335 [Arthrobacter sp. SPG23]|uniref:DUF937 domain-containing protein n=1 Tax=Arthrobacter sp. SPG23 TaxID=1610703 RepID=UPI0005BDB90E|nr:DUF937 domain-containing protein [Arthrobacter sp. SPG23]KIS28030.1 hypothetical protein TV39_07335 [Arthrobacter sp. SPG23]